MNAGRSPSGEEGEGERGGQRKLVRGKGGKEGEKKEEEGPRHALSSASNFFF
jgi:hypothetical protein